MFHDLKVMVCLYNKQSLLCLAPDSAAILQAVSLCYFWGDKTADEKTNVPGNSTGRENVNSSEGKGKRDPEPG